MERTWTKEDALAYKARWEAVRELELEELRASSPYDNFRALATLMSAARLFGWSTRDPAEDESLQADWHTYREYVATH